MFSVLIVEDEMLVSIGLKNMINWTDMNMQVIAEAQDGKAALEIYHKKKPDLILTDIKMPVMDGLELISEIRKNDKKTRIIILTCYQEFDLVRQALKLGVSDYIPKLKMSTDEMESVIKKVHEELVRENVAHETNHEDILDGKRIEQKILEDYLLYQVYSDEEFSRMASENKFRVGAYGLVLCVMRIERYEQLHHKFDGKHEKTIWRTILNMIDELLEKYHRGEIIHENEERFLLLFSFGDVASEQVAQALLLEILDRIGVIMKTYINTPVTFGVSSRADQYASLNHLYVQASTALEESYFIGNRKLIQFADAGNKNAFLSAVKGLEDFVSGTENLNNEYRKEIFSGIRRMEEMYLKPKFDIQEFFIRWIHWPTVNTIVYENDSSEFALVNAGRLRNCTTLDETIEVFEQYLSAIIQSQSNTKSASKEVTEAVKYIRANYRNDISLQKISEHVEMSANYLSSLFKKELQQSVVDYVNWVRVDEAKRLLLNTHLKTYEISQKVGFADESYFSRIFKRITGMRPNEYKKLSIRQMAAAQEKTDAY